MSAPKDQLKQANENTEVREPGMFDPVNNGLNVAVPLAALILGTGAAWKLTDAWADKRRNRMLSESIANKTKTLNSLMRTRAMLAKGTATQKQLNDAMAYLENSEAFTKEAKGFFDTPIRIGSTAVGVLALGLIGMSALGAYEYYSEADPNNIKYKATKKGLNEYAKSKSLMTPITITPNDARKFFKGIDASAKKPTTVREESDLEVERHQPISVTL